MAEIPVACTLSAEALRTRREGLLATMLRRAQQHEFLGDGLRVRFDPGADVIAALAQVVDAERQCCRFLRFVITVEPDGGPVSLELSGPAGTREFLAGVLDL